MQKQKKWKQLITLDFETYYSKEYGLRNKDLNTSEYVRHPEFKAQCVGIKINDEPVAWYRDVDVETVLKSINWSESALLAHHTAFDGLILSHHYGIVPAYYLDTLSMARALFSNGLGAGLNEVATFYKLGNKLPDVLDKTKGVRDLDDALMNSLGTYCAVDVELCRMIFDKMIVGFPEDELDLIDMTVRMFCDPVLYIDIPRVEVALEEEKTERAQIIADSGVPIETLSSSQKFADALRIRGIIPPTKTSPTTGNATYAFSKTDLEFTALREHPDERIRKLVAGRFAAKSTIGESRAARFLATGKDGKRLPVYLNYFGAHTGRWSAGNKMNLQNLKRGGELRRSIIAPPKHVIVVADSAQIEARVTAWLANDSELLELFEQGADVYKHMASQIYNIPVDEVTKDQRFIGKIAVLGLGYGMGWAKFQHTLATGAMGPAVQLSDAECQRIVSMYRRARAPVAKLWRDMDTILYKLVAKIEGSFGPLTYDKECKVWLPNGLYLQYPFITADYDHVNEKLNNYRYYNFEAGVKRMFGQKIDEKHAHYIYGGLLTENVVQALARIIVSDQMLRIKRNLVDLHNPAARVAHSAGLLVGRVVTMTHDEVVVCCPEDQGDSMLSMMIDEMRVPPAWCSNIPLNAEGGWDFNYSK